MWPYTYEEWVELSKPKKQGKKQMKKLKRVFDIFFAPSEEKGSDPLWILATTEYRNNPQYAYEQLKKGLRP